ncbi:MAG TPA: twin-arginine translocation signal domain-containing protein [Actinomycetota bacterium]|nr:twin-arginine translocation signal domain-containing protein [Actinomycetota bacterium]
MSTEDRKSVERREFLRKAAVTGAAAAWAAPIVQTVAATPAFAQTSTTPATCHHSLGGISGGGCMSACQASGSGCGSTCQNQCNNLCPVQQGAGSDRLCNCAQACDPAKWVNCTYQGALSC